MKAFTPKIDLSVQLVGAEKGAALGSPNAQGLGWVVYNDLHT